MFGPAKRLLDTKETALILNLQPQTLVSWRHTRRVELPYVKLGRAVRYDPEAIKAFIQAQSAPDREK